MIGMRLPVQESQGVGAEALSFQDLGGCADQGYEDGEVEIYNLISHCHGE
jgi:hypothetical protein